MRALLALADGTYFEGESFGAAGEAMGEVVFNTSMMGYQEICTDPSYRGQIVTLTYPLIGNYGVNPDDSESRRPWLRALVVREYTPEYSNWRADDVLPARPDGPALWIGGHMPRVPELVARLTEWARRVIPLSEQALVEEVTV